MVFIVRMVNAMKRGNPFNTSQTARPFELVNRTKETLTFESFLDSTMRRSPVNLAIVGIRGIGKTSLLAKFEELAVGNKCIVVRLEGEEGRFDSVFKIYKEILTGINIELTKRHAARKLSKKVEEFLERYSFTLSVGDIGLKIEKGEQAGEEPYPAVFREKMLEVWENVKKETPAIVFMIDEAEYLEQIRGALMALRNTFSRLGEKQAGYMLILSGRLSFHKEMSEIFSPLTRFFHPLELGPLEEKDVRQLVKLHLSKTGVSIEDKCVKKIAENSQGHPYVVLVMGRVLYNNLPEKERVITALLYEKSTKDILEYLAAELFSGMYNKLSETEKRIVRLIAGEGGKLKTGEIAKKLRIDYGPLSPYLNNLQKKGAVIKKKRGEYEIFHKLFGNYALEQN